MKEKFFLCVCKVMPDGIRVLLGVFTNQDTLDVFLSAALVSSLILPSESWVVERLSLVEFMLAFGVVLQEV